MLVGRAAASMPPMSATTETAKSLWQEAVTARDQGDPVRALELLGRAAELAPERAEIPAEAGLTCMIAGDLESAEAWFRDALALAPDSIEVLINLGALLQHRGHPTEAAVLYQQALGHEPDEIEVRCNLAKALADCGRLTEALAEVDRAITDSGGSRGALATRGAVLIDTGDYAAARATLLDSLQAEPTNDMALVNLALCCLELGDDAAATSYLMRAVELNPQNARAVADLVNALSRAGENAEALELARGFLSAYPGERLVLGSYAQALFNAGEPDPARALTDPDLLVQVFDLQPPAGYPDASDFHAQLAHEVLNEPSLLRDPVSKATRGGGQTGELTLGRSDALTAFGALMDSAIRDATKRYLEQGFSEHPVMTPAADTWSLRAWGTVLQAGGAQTPHMHPLGWLSAVYYVALPDAMTESDPEAGWLEFGMSPQRLFQREDPPTRRIEALPGRLVVFPSWLWHRTLPFAATGDRISIAFDVMPGGRLRSL